MPKQEHKRHPLNCDGLFYVENQCCITCDLPRTLAPDMFRYTDKKDHCYVYRQPATDEELQRMIQAMEGAEVLCVRCRSRDKSLLRILKGRHLTEQCDFS
jgi:ferredoxin